MPPIKISNKNYQELQRRMGIELKKKIEENPKLLSENKVIVTFDEIITKLLGN